MIPKSLREDLGLRPGVVEVTAEGTGIRIEVPADHVLEERNGRLVISAAGTGVDDDVVRSLRDAAQK